MKILILSFYYQPDLCVGSFRATAFVKELEKLGPTGLEIDIVTTMPNRYNSFVASVPERETHGSISITRIALPSHQSGMLDQSRAFLVYALGALGHVRRQKYDVIFATSSRLMTAVLGALISRLKGVPLFLDIRDIFVDTIKDILPKWILFPVLPIFRCVEKFAIEQADKVNLVSEGFLPYFRSRYRHRSYSVFTNGVDDEFVGIGEKMQGTGSRCKGGATVVLYAGNIGEGQGLHSIIPQLAEKMGPGYQFKVIGDGGRRGILEEIVRKENISNVSLVGPMGRKSLLREYEEADILFLHLNSYEAFEKVLPSKIFEYAATGKPIWAGVGGYASRFIREKVENAVVFEPCNVEDAVHSLMLLNSKATSRDEFVRSYSRETICREMSREVLALAREGQSQ